MKIIVGNKKEEHWQIDDQIIRNYTKTHLAFGKLNLKNEINLDNIDYIEVYFISQSI